MIIVSMHTSLTVDVRKPLATPETVQTAAKAKGANEDWPEAEQFRHAAQVIAKSSEELRRAIDAQLSGTHMNVLACHMGVEPGSIILTALVVIATGAARSIGEGTTAALKSRAEAAVERGITSMLSQWTTRDPAMAAIRAAERIAMTTTIHGSPSAPPAPVPLTAEASVDTPEAVVAPRRWPLGAASAGVLVLLALILAVLVDSNYDLERRTASSTQRSATTVATSPTTTP